MSGTSVRAPVWRPLRLATLVNLRWLAIGGQTLGVVLTAVVLGFSMPLLPCLALIGLSVVLNLFFLLRFGSGHRLTNRVAAIHLGYDLMQLGGLLWLTGGLENPFSLLLLAPVSVAATTLTRAATVILSVLAVLIASVLAVVHQPLPWSSALPLQLDELYVTGTWVSLLLGVAFVAAYTNRVAHEARQLADAVAATELTLSRQQRLSALDGLAAAAAHELGTPLSTIALAAKEMRSELPEGPLAEDADLIVAQAARCRAILGKLRNLEDEDGGPFEVVPLRDLVAEAAKFHERSGAAIRISDGVQSGPEPTVARNVGLVFGLGNLIENAVHFARDTVEIEVGWDRAGFSVTIIDDGPGFPPDLIARLGEPYLTPRARTANADPASPGGLGLGIFIAETLLERTGGQLVFGNTRAGAGARVAVSWPAGAR